ncbi:unnamed protein product [Symbiodinium necroappetens]|uniref:Uncharacterized protein n=1 Tax=Symbiodinium necroappetens TaxID=1628268 RepID=A0A812QHW2_9DINO|nr:unnamed protein product [Symbiodinium necroappetens]
MRPVTLVLGGVQVDGLVERDFVLLPVADVLTAAGVAAGKNAESGAAVAGIGHLTSSAPLCRFVKQRSSPTACPSGTAQLALDATLVSPVTRAGEPQPAATPGDQDDTSTMVVPGCSVLDTGQGTAKSITSDKFKPGLPDLAAAGNREREMNSSRANGGSLRKQVGIPLSLDDRLSRLAENHDWKHGFRLGEASHPGPSGGGSRATARIRNEREEQEGAAVILQLCYAQ